MREIPSPPAFPPAMEQQAQVNFRAVDYANRSSGRKTPPRITGLGVQVDYFRQLSGFSPFVRKQSAKEKRRELRNPLGMRLAFESKNRAPMLQGNAILTYKTVDVFNALALHGLIFFSVEALSLYLVA
jgi:hypothetical protein